MVEEIQEGAINKVICPALFDMLLTPNYEDVEPDPEHVEKMLTIMRSNPYSIMLADFDTDGNVRGVIMGMVAPCWYAYSFRATQEFMYVYPEHRSGTVPLRLIRAFEQRARELGADSFVMGNSSGEQIEKFASLMGRCGYSPFSVTFKKEE